MPCHHHHHRCSGCCCSCASSCCTSCAAASPPPPSAADHILQLLATQLFLHPDPPPPSRRRSKHSQTPPNVSNPFHHHQNQTHEQQEQIPLLQSLIQRISSLESQLSRQHSPPPPHSPPRRAASPTVATPPAKSLRDLAARTIQIHFRRYLVKRSQNLRNLHRLAAVKSRAAALRSSLSDRRLNPSIAAAASDLLLDLHSIQSSDPVIREGKRSIEKELVRIEDFIHKFSAKDAGKDTRRDQRRTAAKKRVSFPSTTLYSELGDQIQMNDNGGDCYGGLDEEDREVKEVKEISEEEEDIEEEEEESGKSGDSERLEGQKRKFGLSPPVPVHMESRRS